MDTAILEISWHGLLIAFVPTAIVIGIMAAWRSVVGTALYATARMLVQLLLIGYVLIYIFRTDNWLIIAGVLLIMLTVSSWIATRTLEQRTLGLEGNPPDRFGRDLDRDRSLASGFRERDHPFDGLAGEVDFGGGGHGKAGGGDHAENGTTGKGADGHGVLPGPVRQYWTDLNVLVCAVSARSVGNRSMDEAP